MKYSSSNTSKPSSWWQDLKAVSFVEGGGGWFDTNLKRRVGRGNDVRFWEEVWHNEYLLKDKYPRLYLMSTKANKSIEEMGVWRDGTWTWEFGWRRSLRDTELSMLNNLLSILQGFTPHTTDTDGWIWIANPEGKFSVSSAYSCLTGPMKIFASFYGRHLHPLLL